MSALNNTAPTLPGNHNEVVRRMQDYLNHGQYFDALRLPLDGEVDLPFHTASADDPNLKTLFLEARLRYEPRSSTAKAKLREAVIHLDETTTVGLETLFLIAIEAVWSSDFFFADDSLARIEDSRIKHYPDSKYFEGKSKYLAAKIELYSILSGSVEEDSHQRRMNVLHAFRNAIACLQQGDNPNTKRWEDDALRHQRIAEDMFQDRGRLSKLFDPVRFYVAFRRRPL